MKITNLTIRSFLSMHVLPISTDVVWWSRLHSRSAFCPTSRTNLPILSIVLETLDKSQQLCYITTNPQIVNAYVSQDLVVIDNEGSSESDSSVIEHSIIWSDLLFNVSQEWDIDASKPSLILRLKSPSSVDKMRVDGAADNLAPTFSEGLGLVAELYDFGGADKGEVKRVEEEEEPFALEVSEWEFLELVGGWDPSVSLEERSGFSNNCLNCLTGHKIYLLSSNRPLHLQYKIPHR